MFSLPDVTSMILTAAISVTVNIQNIFHTNFAGTFVNSQHSQFYISIVIFMETKKVNMTFSRHFAVLNYNRGYIMLIKYLLRHKIGGHCLIYDYKAYSLSVFNYVFPFGTACIYSRTDVTKYLHTYHL
jgi:hypothetical protein